MSLLRAVAATVALLATALLVALSVEAVRQQAGPWGVVLGAGVLGVAGAVAVAVRSRAVGVAWPRVAAVALGAAVAGVLGAALLHGSAAGALALGPLGGGEVVLALAMLAVGASAAALFVPGALPGRSTGAALVRAVGTVAAAYALIALGLAFADGGLGAVARGEAFAAQLPLWLQGPAVGLAFVAAVAVGALVWGLRQEGARPLASALVLALPAVPLVALAALAPAPEAAPLGLAALPGDSTEAAAPRDPAAPLPPISAPADTVVDVAAALAKLDALAGRLGARRYSVDSLAAALDGPDAAFAFVRDSVGLDPYAGSLRGAAGALAARAGNATDRALLLQALLRAQGAEARLAFGALPDAAAARVAARAAATAPAGFDAQAAAAAGFAGASLERLRARYRRDAGWVAEGFREALADATPGAPAAPDAARHAWVQLRDGGGWTDLDPTLAAAAPGEALAEAAETPGDVPDADRHTVTIRVVAESAGADGALTEAVVLESVRPAAEAARDAATLVFTPTAASAGLGGALAGAMGQEAKIRPVLIVGGDDTSGETLPALGAGAAPPTDAQSFFGGGADAGAARLSALWLEVETAGPGAPADVRRRPLLDRLAEADRAAGRAGALADVPRIDKTAAPFLALHQVVVSTGGADPYAAVAGAANALLFVARKAATPEAVGGLSMPELVWPVAQMTARLALASERVSLPLAQRAGGARLFVGRPRAFVASTEPGADDTAAAIDLMHDEVAWTGGTARDAVVAKARYGVAQAAMETTAAEVRALGAGAGLDAVVSASTALAGPPAALAEAGPAWPAALRADLAAGRRVAVADPDAPAPAWWALSPETGRLDARLAPGLGGSGFTWGRNYVNASQGGPRYHIDPRTGRVLGTSQNGVYRPNRPPPPSKCRGGNEYQTVLGCVSIPASMTAGWAVGMVVIEVFIFALLTIVQL